MAAANKFLIAVVFLIGGIAAFPANDKDTVTDIHLNAVLPECEKPSVFLRAPLEIKEAVVVKKEEDVEIFGPVQADSSPPHLELIPDDAEQTTEKPYEPSAERPSYFSRVITSIFEIPIAVLTSVRNLLQTTANKSPLTAQ